MGGLFMFGLEAGGGEATPPTVTLISPAEGPVPSSQPIVFDVEDETELGLLRIDAELADGETWEGVWRPSGFSKLYADGSSRVELEAGKRYRFTVYRKGSWPKNFSISVDAVDAAGNEAS